MQIRVTTDYCPDTIFSNASKKNTETHFFVNLGFFDMLFFTAAFKLGLD